MPPSTTEYDPQADPGALQRLRKHKGADVPAAAVEQAAQWLVRLQSDDSEQARAACLAWRNAHPDHEKAWRRFDMLRSEISQARAQPELRTESAARALLKGAEAQSRRRALKWMVGAASVGATAWLADAAVPWRGWAADQRTATGEQRRLTLADGTQLLLNTGSAVDIEYDARQRTVVLRHGEILVATGRADAHRPFAVVTPQGRIRPIGTRFTVRRLEGEDATQVVVAQGAVHIRPSRSEQTQVLQAGQQARFTATEAETAAPSGAGATAWEDGLIIADHMRLDDFIAELGRYRPGLLRCDPAIAGQRISGTFRVEDTDKTLQALAHALGHELQYRSRYWVTIRPAEPGQG